MTVQVTTLANGIQVATDTFETIETVSVGAWVSVGTRHESPELNGISHLLEHMAFKGTERRSAQAIAEEIEAVGGRGLAVVCDVTDEATITEAVATIANGLGRLDVVVANAGFAVVFPLVL